MSTGEALKRLRKKFGWKQTDLAALLQMTPNIISRYERGQEPSPAVLTKLVELCGKLRLTRQAGPELDSLYALFEAKRRSDIVARVENLASPGSSRRLSVTDLRLLRAGLRLIGLYMKNLVFDPSVTVELMQLTARESLDMANELLDVVEPYLSFAPEVRVNNALAGEATEIRVEGVRVGSANEELEASDYGYLSPLVPGNAVRSGYINDAMVEVKMIQKENLSREGKAEVAALVSEFSKLGPSEVKQRGLLLDKLRVIRTNVVLGPDRMAEWAAEEPLVFDSTSEKMRRPEELSSESQEQNEQYVRAREQRAEDTRRQCARPTEETQPG